MSFAWFRRVKTKLAARALAARAFGEASEFETTRQLAYVNERLQRDFLIPFLAIRPTSIPTDPAQSHVRPQDIARRSCRAY